MCTAALQHFCNRIAEVGVMTREDAAHVSPTLLPDGITSRDEADLLFALDRAADCDPVFSEFLVATIVDFAVWGERPTGIVTRETAEWLALTIRGRSGPTPTGRRAAIEIVRAAQVSDETLIAFALEANIRSGRSARPLLLAA